MKRIGMMSSTLVLTLTIFSNVLAGNISVGKDGTSSNGSDTSTPVVQAGNISVGSSGNISIGKSGNISVGSNGNISVGIMTEIGLLAIFISSVGF